MRKLFWRIRIERRARRVDAKRDAIERAWAKRRRSGATWGEYEAFVRNVR